MESSRWKYIAIIATAALATVLIALLLVNIFTRKQEARQAYVDWLGPTPTPTTPPLGRQSSSNDLP